MFNWGMRRRLISANPFAAAVIEGREVSRDRVLSDAELGEAWRASGTLGPPFDAYLRILMLTLQRRAEVAGMLWSELSDDLSVWTVPAERAKNGKAHIVHLAEPARAILAGIPRHRASGYVFTTTGKTPITGFQDAKERLHAKIIGDRTKSAEDGQDGGSPVSISPLAPEARLRPAEGLKISGEKAFAAARHRMAAA